MDGRKKNKGKKKNKGGGRKSAYAERKDAEWHEKIWKYEQDVPALEKKIRKGKYAGRDMAALRLLKGDKYVIGKFMDKLVPDLHEITGEVTQTHEVRISDYARTLLGEIASDVPEMDGSDGESAEG